MNNTDLTEKLCLHIIRNSNLSEISEGIAGKEAIRFLKDSGILILQIKKLKENQELFLDLIEPVGFVSILKEDNKYVITIVIKGQKSKVIIVEKPLEVYKKIFDIFKDQMTTGIKNLKLKYEIHN